MDHTEQTTPRDHSKSYLLLLIVLAIGIVAYAFAGGGESSGDLAYDFGRQLPIAIMLGGLIYLPFKSKIKTSLAWSGFAIIFGALVIASLISFDRYNTQATALKKELKNAFTQVTDSLSRGESPEKIPAIASQSNSEMGKLGTLMEKILNLSLQQQRNYEQEINAIGFLELLSPQRLAHDKDLVESRSIIVKAKAIISRYSNATDEHFAKMRAELEHADLSEKAKRDVLRGFDKSSGQSKIIAIQLWAYETQIVEVMDQIITELTNKRKQWYVRDDRIVFGNASLHQLISKKMERVQQLGEQEEELRRSAVKRANENLDKVN